MRIMDDNSAVLDSTFDLQLNEDGQRLDIALHSAGGRGAEPGSTHNPDYPPRSRCCSLGWAARARFART